MGVVAGRRTSPLIRQASAFIKIEEGRPRWTRLVLHCVSGVGNPVDRRGHAAGGDALFRRPRAHVSPLARRAAGAAGGLRPPGRIWQRLGQMRAPGRLIEVRCSEPVDVAFSHLELNPLRAAQ